MNTGTPLDLTSFGTLLTGISALYWIFALGIAAVAWRIPKQRWVKVVTALAVLTVLVYPVVSYQYAKHQRIAAFKGRQNEALALFKKRCQSAGEHLVRTVDNVDGVVWLKWRPRLLNDGNQFTLDDPYGRDCGEEDCIKQLLRVTRGLDIIDPDIGTRQTNGYRFVETIDPIDRQRYRYFAVIKKVRERTPNQMLEYEKNTGKKPRREIYGLTLEREPIEAFTANYGITWDDISTQEDRMHWIAGGSMRVLDLRTNDVIAERVGYMVDRWLGSTAGARQPWLFAREDACPPSDRTRDGRAYGSSTTAPFVHKVLRPTQGGSKQ